MYIKLILQTKYQVSISGRAHVSLCPTVAELHVAFVAFIILERVDGRKVELHLAHVLVQSHPRFLPVEAAALVRHLELDVAVAAARRVVVVGRHAVLHLHNGHSPGRVGRKML